MCRGMGIFHTMETTLKALYRGILFPILRGFSQFLQRVSSRRHSITMPAVDPFQASCPEELLYLCKLEFQDRPPLLNRSFVNVCPSSVEESEGKTIRLMTWNALADALCNGTENFIKCPKEALNWQTRKFRCMEEILTYNPDVVCLQEIDHFKDFFQPLMRQIGYAGSFKPKPDSPCLDCLHNVGPDGCALFYKEDRFDLLDQSLPILEASRRGTVYLTNQVAVLNKLQLRSQDAGKTRPFLVGTTHLKAKPGWESLRYKQGRNFMDIAKTMSNGCPIVIGGDFNAEPVEAVYRSFESEFVSAYKSAGGLNQEPPYTTWKIRPRGEMCHTIDYIWHSKDSIQPVSLLQFPSGDEIGENRLPSWSYPSDHFSLVCDFVIKP